jgi:hypothetical protein
MGGIYMSCANAPSKLVSLVVDLIVPFFRDGSFASRDCAVLLCDWHDGGVFYHW